jgi:putative ABC transport system ATP-binding protein
MSLRVESVALVLGDGDQQVKALDNVSFEVAPGELLAVVGPSGSGKSSLLAVCGGLRKPTSGKIHVGDTEITGLDPEQLTRVRREKIGFVFQQSNLLPALTVLDQLLLTVHLRGTSPGTAARDRAMGLLQQVGMDGRSHRRPAELSGGERQRVGIARALMSSPSVLLVDEPTSMLDQSRGRQIVSLLRGQCHEHGVAALMVTHDPEMLEFVDRAVHIHDGRLQQLERAHAAH